MRFSFAFCGILSEMAMFQQAVVCFFVFSFVTLNFTPNISDRRHGKIPSSEYCLVEIDFELLAVVPTELQNAQQ